MNQHLQSILHFIQQDESLTAEEKNALLKSLKEADKELDITAFKLERTEKVKRTTAILLEETIEELEQKRKAVEAQNRELEIETSLERVRAQAMSMSKPDDLMDICEVIYTELQLLGFNELRNAMINIYHDDKYSFLNYDYSAGAGKTVTVIPYNFHPLVEKQVSITKNANDAFYEMSFAGNELKDFRELRKNNGEPDDPKLDEIASLHYYHYSIGTGSIGISTYNAITENKLELLKRFRNVFNLSYQRYTDITKAEAQAREAHIELALERVRARTMAMQHSDELKEASYLLFQQVLSLGIPIWSCGFNIWEKGEKFATGWMSTRGAIQPSFRIPLADYPTFIRMHESRMEGNPFYVEEVSGEALAEHYRYMFSLPDFKVIAEEQLKEGFALPESQVNHVYNFNHGNLVFLSAKPIPDASDIFKRFTAVFEQTYTRFLDLQKAEAQAREAQIEASLERVRSRAMAMQTSEELNALIGVVFIELTRLDLALTRCAILIYEGEDGEKGSRQWMANTEAASLPMSFFVAYSNLPYLNAIIKAWDERLLKWEYTLEGENKFITDEFLLKQTELSRLPDFVIAAMRAPGKVYISGSFNNFGGILLASLNPLPDDQFDILLRFARVFDLTYTRFNDLQVAETQAREAKIEAALERTRTQSMIMQHSNELDDTLRVFHEQVLLLGIHSAFSFLWLPDEKNERHIFWATWKENDSTIFKSKAINYPLNRNEPATKQCLIDWKSNEPVYSYHVPSPAVENYFALWTELIDGVEHLKPEYFSGGLHYVEAFMKYGCFGVMVTTDLTEDEKKLLNRFAVEFERTYTRFLDLQKAEAQAREAQIETALERVRARTMAMHKSEDILEVIQVLSQQFEDLGFNVHSTNFNTTYREKDWNLWLYNPGSLLLKEQLRIPYFKHPYFDRTREFLDYGLDLHSLIFTKEEKDGFLDHLYANTVAKYASDERKKFTYDSPGFAWTAVYLKNTALTVANYDGEPYTEEQNSIIRRFGNVFEQSYTRFLDLQKAEAQAREAQIEAALEKVRSGSLAMHRSDELQQVVVSLFDRLVELGLAFDGACIYTFEKETRNINLWIATNHLSAPIKVDLPYDEDIKNNAINKDLWNAIENGEHIINRSYSGEIKNDYFRYVAKYNESKVPESVRKLQIEAKSWTVHLAAEKNSMIGYDSWSGHSITGEDFQIVIKFAKVFEQAYIRFLDLQKAEEQARESQIQLGLERVRARTMAMQSSDELRETVLVINEQLQQLNFESNATNIIIIDKDTGNTQYWVSGFTKDVFPVSYHVPWFDHPCYEALLQPWKQGRQYVVYKYEGGDKKSFDKIWFTKTGFKNVPEEAKNAMMGLPSVTLSTAYLSTGALQIIGPEALSEEKAIILQRFAKVFEQTYTRFLDLQKAEDQAREARIETALEKIRSRSLGMHRSVEIKDVVAILFEKLKELDLVFDGGAAIHLFTEGSRDAVIWVASPLAEPSCVNLPYEENAFQNNPIIMDVWHAKETGEHIYNKFYSFEEKNRYFDYVFNHNDFLAVPKSVREFIPQADSYTASFIAEKNSLLGANSWTRQLFSESDFDILKRIARVFEQAYIRFLDLQKAETQAREARIEAALEKVRSRSMAMHKSEELREVVKVVFEKLQELNFVLDDGAVSILIFKEGSNDHTQWIADPDHLYAASFDIAYTDHSISADVINVKKSGVDYFSKTYPTEEKNEYFKYLFAHTDYKHLPDEVKNLILGSKQYGLSVAFAKNSAIVIPTNSGKLLAEDEKEILKRFVKVFDQAYTRFLDLQKAEAQAREAQIEASLERVRSKTMAMQRSDDLYAVILEVNAQLQLLNFRFDSADFLTDYSDKGYKIWVASVQENVPKPIYITASDNKIPKLLKEAMEGGKDFFTFTLNKKEKNKYFDHVFATPVAKEASEEAKQFIYNAAGMAVSCFVVKNIILSIANFACIPYKDSENDILRRFAFVFEQSYTRFLDLQKAEAQAREAQIEASLERVRSRTMAMHKSDELLDIIIVVSEQLQQLNIKFGNVSFGVNNQNYDLQLWMAVKGYPKAYPIHWTFLDNPGVTRLKDAQQKPEMVYADVLTQAENNEWMQHIFNCNPTLEIFSEEARNKLLNTQGYARSIVVMKDIFLVMGNYAVIPYTDDENAILKRFANVFEQAYKRFLDLQKAEAQARESQIQLALERVRARTMAMQRSDELSETAVLLFHQLMSLGLDLKGCGFNIWEKDEKTCTAWMTGPEGTLNPPFNLPLTEDPFFIRYYYESRQKGEDFWAYETGKEELIARYKYLQTLPVIGELLKKEQKEGVETEHPPFVVDHIVNFSNGNLIFISYRHYPEAWDIFKRFGKVFEQTYTRFLDLQKAEAQARESQIQLALERVRAVAMAMKQSEELISVCEVMYKELLSLGFTNIRNAQIAINLRAFESWLIFEYSDYGAINMKTVNVSDGNISPLLQEIATEIAKSKDALFQKHITGKEFEEWRTWRIKTDRLEDPRVNIAHSMCFYLYAVESGLLGISTFDEITEEQVQVLKRFKKVFELCYTRFDDLQKAEAQSRESQIQLALERVRARTMAMQHSDELKDAAALLFQQVKSLGAPAYSCGYNIWEKDDKEFTSWMSTQDGSIINGVPNIPLTEDANFIRYVESKQNGEQFFVLELHGERMQEHYQYLKTIPAFKAFFDYAVSVGFDLPETQIHHLANFSQGNLLFITLEPCPEFHDVFKRFAAVFQQTYTRFLDLQNAEAQARESQIELALERVRSKTMTMHNSHDVGDTVAVMFDELVKLGTEKTIRCGIIIIDDSKQMEVWNASDNGEGKISLVIGRLDMAIHPALLKVYNAWKNKLPEISYEFIGEDLKDYFRVINNSPEYPFQMDIASLPPRSFLSDYFFGEGAIFAFTHDAIDTETTQIFKRFAAVFGQTYRRYLDLLKAEAQARESQIEAALERVRSKTLAMQKSDDLAETAAELFRQLIGLGIEPNRLYIGIVNGETRDMEMWATDEDGTGVGKKFTFNAADNASVKKLYDGWLDKIKSVTVDMQGAELDNYISYLQQLQIPLSHALTQKRRVQSVAYFDKGFIGMASPDEQSASNIHLLERFAAVFNLTFTRFNDLKLAEAHALQAEQDLIAIKEAKQKAEEALTELQSAQKQLIQSEKMASLGELTAGIAHEIQNPLNFVNNFSEVNKELIEELKMKNEKLKIDNVEINELLEDIKDNSEKINHHGKRADAIVKGMLQHSQTSAGKKEPTDISKLADEYLRLAYHGLRAKDKSFNATLKTDYDESIGNVNIIPQDIGRALLNLYNNAFYAVSEKQKAESLKQKAYEPTLSISTKRTNEKVEIKVSDNGDGIPQKIVDKIFQPFFTTKPTGQGTGLGLSLAYDIVKAHGGELKVETKESIGTTFIIQLPATNA